jgi:K+-sensing histidine kinase KdpD
MSPKKQSPKKGSSVTRNALLALIASMVLVIVCFIIYSAVGTSFILQLFFIATLIMILVSAVAYSHYEFPE